MLAVKIRAYWHLLRLEPPLARGSFASLSDRVRRRPVQIGNSGDEAVERICAAIEWASIWYWKRVLCLQRSAATACLLRTYGVDARMVIGVQHMPFRAHAWVEVGGRVVNDKPYVPEIYSVIEKC